MSAPYSLKAFNQDMAQLGGMIENFYTQSGGATKKKYVKKVNKSSTKKKGGYQSTDEDNKYTDEDNKYTDEDNKSTDEDNKSTDEDYYSGGATKKKANNITKRS